LAAEGHNIIVLSRHPERHRDLEVLPTLQLRKVETQDERLLIYHFTNVDVIINLIGILNAKDFSGKEFEQVHISLTQKIINACHVQQVKQLIYFSALGADAKEAPSIYLRTKGKAEQLVASAASEKLNTVIFRPSLIIGPDAQFIEQFRMLLRFAPGVLVLPCAYSVYAPVALSDVVAAVVESVMNHECFNQRFDLCGPTTYTLKALVEIMARGLNKKCWIIGLNTFLSLCAARFAQFLPGKPLTPDNVHSSTVESISSDPFLPELQVKPSDIEHLLRTVIQPPNDSFSFFDAIRKMD